MLKGLLALMVSVGLFVGVADCAQVARAQGGPSAQSDSWKSSAFMVVFDCMVPIPSGYVALTKDPKRVSLFSKEDKMNGGRIVISESSKLGGDFDVISQTKVGGLRLTRETYKGKFLPRAKGEEVSVLRGSDQMMVFYGSANSLAEPMARACIKNRGW